MYTRDVMEKEVVGQQGWLIGKVKELIFDPKDWKVTAFEVELEGNIAEQYQMKKHFRSTRVPLHVAYVQGIADKVILNISKDDLGQVVSTAKPTPETPPPSSSSSDSPASRQD